jgi:acetolactate synthase small subunit
VLGTVEELSGKHPRTHLRGLFPLDRASPGHPRPEEETRIGSLRFADIFRTRVVDSTTESFVFEMTGSSEKLNAFITLMEPLGLVEVSRAGAVAISRGSASF